MKSSANRLGTHLYFDGQKTLLHVYQTCTHIIPIACMKYASKCLFDVYTILILCERDCLWVLLISSERFVCNKKSNRGQTVYVYTHTISHKFLCLAYSSNVFFLFFFFLLSFCVISIFRFILTLYEICSLYLFSAYYHDVVIHAHFISTNG